MNFFWRLLSLLIKKSLCAFVKSFETFVVKIVFFNHKGTQRKYHIFITIYWSFLIESI